MRRLNYKADLSALLISGLILAALGWFFSRKPLVLNNQVQLTTETKNETATIEKDLSQTDSGFLYVVKKKNNVKQIVKISLKDDNNEIIYTDSDENQKLVSAIGVTKENIIILESENKQSETGNLTIISNDKKATKVVKQKDFNFNSNPIYDKVNDQIIKVDFSQAERDFGFIVNSEKLDGSNIRDILKNISGILGLTISDSNKILFGQLVDKKTKIMIYDLSGNNIKETNINGVIIDTAWANENIYLTIAPFGNATANQSEINVFSKELVTQESKIKNNDGAEVNIVPISKNLIAYLNVQYKNGIVTNDVEGDIILSDTSDGEEKKLGKAIQIIGFINE